MGINNASDIPRIPILFDGGPFIDHPSNSRNACPVHGSGVEKAEIDVVIIFYFLEFGRAVVCEEDEVDQSIWGLGTFLSYVIDMI